MGWSQPASVRAEAIWDRAQDHQLPAVCSSGIYLGEPVRLLTHRTLGK